MRRRARVSIGAAAVAALALETAAAAFGPAAAAPTTDALVEAVRAKAEHGAWLVVHGARVGDPELAAATLGALGHVAVLDKERGEVVEAVAAGVKVTPLRAFIDRAERLQIVRPPSWTAAAAEAAVARARSRVGRPYDWLDQAAARDGARFYATELAVDAYDGRARGWPLDPVAFPADLARLGTVTFDSGPRSIADDLESRFARRLPAARGVPYAAEVAPGLYRGGQPDAAGIAWLKSIGVKTIVNLRHFHGDRGN